MPRTAVAAGAFIVPDSLGNKIIHPYSDFLLHNIGTGDGVVQTVGQEPANKMRTPPLWGVRTRMELLHDGGSATFFDAVRRHAGEAQPVANNFNRLSTTQQNQLITFLRFLWLSRRTFMSQACRFVTVVLLCENACDEDP